MEYEVMKEKVIKLMWLMLVMYLLIFIVMCFKGKISISIEEYNCPVINCRYFETHGILFSEEKVEVIYEMDSEIRKRSYYVSSIKIGEKTEVVVHKGEKIYFHYSELYMTKDDYENLFSEGNKE